MHLDGAHADVEFVGDHLVVFAGEDAVHDLPFPGGQTLDAEIDRIGAGVHGAPVGVVVTIDRRMGAGCFMDLGMALMAFQLAAADMGYATTGIGALANYGPVAHAHLELPADEMVVCGLALGLADQDHPANAFRTAREGVESFTSFRGF